MSARNACICFLVEKVSLKEEEEEDEEEEGEEVGHQNVIEMQQPLAKVARSWQAAAPLRHLLPEFSFFRNSLHVHGIPS